MIAHVAGVPVEESLLALAGGAGTWLLLVRTWVASRGRGGGAHRRRARSG